MEQPTKTQLDFFRDPLAAGTNGMGANPAVDPSGANRDGSKFGSYFAGRAEASVIADRRRQRVNAPGGMTLDEAMGFAVCVLRKLCADDAMANVARAVEAAGVRASTLAGRGPGDEKSERLHATLAR